LTELELEVTVPDRTTLKPVGQAPITIFFGKRKRIKNNNLRYASNFNFGDVEKGFKDGDHIREETFTSQRVTVGFIEPHACTAEVDPTGRILCDGY
jgi:CO/xanthine dehydrogenase Mo-binding subunit